MEETWGCHPVLSLLLWVPLLGGVTAGDPRGGPGGGVPPPPPDDLLSRLGRATWLTLEGWVGSQPLGLVAESFSATLWLISSGISVALATTCGIVGDLLATAGVTGQWGVGRTVALGPKEVQRVLLWAVATLVASWLLRRLRGLLQPALRWVKLCCFLGAFLHIAASPETPTAQAGMLLALGVLYSLLGGLGGAPQAPPPSAQLEAAVRSLEWKVEELRRRQKWGGPRNREE
ncbi:LOW QUALITY PROTEIN: voltage-gated monoatomic cation channel TMEM109 [Heliangelus exortis]|uniref:LOW QUALITY PROTEIN: voltage-gated monoatomic cation channel TMEM109 n=1 Tax=Heliangelus exortis TaxID=472823 RepID=UPI003A92358C